jgi:hypothetical protein
MFAVLNMLSLNTNPARSSTISHRQLHSIEFLHKLLAVYQETQSIVLLLTWPLGLKQLLLMG